MKKNRNHIFFTIFFSFYCGLATGILMAIWTWNKHGEELRIQQQNLLHELRLERSWRELHLTPQPKTLGETDFYKEFFHKQANP